MIKTKTIDFRNFERRPERLILPEKVKDALVKDFFKGKKEIRIKFYI